LAERGKPAWLEELERLEELRVRVARFVERVSREFDVPPPRVFVKKDLKKTCCFGFYDDVEKAIHVDAEVDLRTVLHELAHHIQFTKLGLTVDPAEFSKPHCNRGFEAEAKAFEMFYYTYYYDLWRRIVLGERGG
jgi:hypothetical protein